MKRTWLIAILTCASVVVGATLVLASGDSRSRSAGRVIPAGDRGTRGPTAQGPTSGAMTGQASGGGCRLGIDTQDQAFIPSSESETFDFASGVQINKPCQGVVVGQFVAETGANSKGSSDLGFLNAVMVATCVAKGGFTNPCTVGQEVEALPGVFILDDPIEPSEGWQTHSMNAVWPNLKRGVWLFEVYVLGDGSTGAIGLSTFHVEAFAGGPTGPTA